MNNLSEYLNLNADLQNAVMQDLDCVDAFRKTGDKRHLFEASKWKKIIREKQPLLLQLHEELIAQIERSKIKVA